jgi:hypothetical protein
MNKIETLIPSVNIEPPDVAREDTHKLDPALGPGPQSMSVLGPMLKRLILFQL